MKITVVRKTPTKDTLKAIYDLCNKVYKNDKYFYSSNEIKELKKDKSNVFL